MSKSKFPGTWPGQPIDPDNYDPETFGWGNKSPKNPRHKFWPAVIFVVIVLLAFATVRACAQPIPFQISFTRAYLGTYNSETREVKTLNWNTDITSIDVVFDGSAINCAFNNRSAAADTLNLQLTLQSTTAGDDFVEYKYRSVDGYLVFLRYNRYYIQGIFEMSIFTPDTDRFIYIKKQRSTNSTNSTTAHE